MRMPLLPALAGLAIGFAVPALAFEGNLAGDVKALDEFAAFGMKYDEAYKESDAAALAVLFTEDGVLVTPEGLFSGRPAVEKWYADSFERWHPTNNIGQTDQLNGIDNGAWAVGKWWCTFQSQNGPVFARGYWSTIYARDGDGWKIRMSTFNQTPAPAAPAETK
jgi:ketosteroid isomerase-like protein